MTRLKLWQRIPRVPREKKKGWDRPFGCFVDHCARGESNAELWFRLLSQVKPSARGHIFLVFCTATLALKRYWMRLTWPMSTAEFLKSRWQFKGQIPPEKTCNFLMAGEKRESWHWKLRETLSTGLVRWTLKAFKVGRELILFDLFLLPKSKSNDPVCAAGCYTLSIADLYQRACFVVEYQDTRHVASTWGRQDVQRMYKACILIRRMQNCLLWCAACNTCCRPSIRMCDFKASKPFPPKEKECSTSFWSAVFLAGISWLPGTRTCFGSCVTVAVEGEMFLGRRKTVHFAIAVIWSMRSNRLLRTLPWFPPTPRQIMIASRNCYEKCPVSRIECNENESAALCHSGGKRPDTHHSGYVPCTDDRGGRMGGDNLQTLS